MIVTVHPSKISGAISAPPSKSSMQRACAAASLSARQTIINNAGTSNDDLAAIDVIKALGCVVEETGDNILTVSGPSDSNDSSEIIAINCGESGLGLRMFAPIAGLKNSDVNINGSGSLVKRPMNFFDEIFPKLGITIQSNNGKLPIHLKGPLQPADITIDGSLSSQFLTGLMMAYAKACDKPVSIKVNNLKSIPYINLTLSVLKDFGWIVKHTDHKEFFFIKQTPLEPITYTVEGDWSSASFLLVAGAIAGDISVTGLDVNSTQADRAIIDGLKAAGARLNFSGNFISISKSNLHGFEFNATDCPDLFPPLVSLAAYCNGTTVIKGNSRLAHKESNRSLTLQSEFKKMGVDISMDGDEMKIIGIGDVNGALVHSNHDHRIAMACAVAGLGAKGDTVIHEAEAINKSYPGFYSDLQLLKTDLQIS
ncbi:MAG: 3-phosphoshikimate 1-carboxyvinyltransferase [Ginsengibacter sp.]